MLQLQALSLHTLNSSSSTDLCEHLCSEKLKLALATVAAGLLFPLLVWGGYALLPFDPPLLESAPLRVVYTLRCAFFATIPIVLGKGLLLYALGLSHMETNGQWSRAPQVVMVCVPLQVCWCRA